MKKLYKVSGYTLILILMCILLHSCGDKPINEGFESQLTDDGCLITKTPATATGHHKINLFIETSGSMFGFMPASNKTAFQTTVWDIVSLLNSNGGEKNYNMFQLRSQTEAPLPINISTFRQDLNSGAFQSISQTDIPEMIDSVLKRTNKNDVSIIISDLIFSPSDHSPALLDQISTDIRNRFINKNLGSDIIQLNSQFYFKTKNAPVPNSPYYLWVIGDKNNVAKVSKTIKSRLADFNEITHGLTFNNINYSIVPFAEINTTATPTICTNSNRYYTYTEWDGSPLPIEVSIAVNLKDLPPAYQTQSYLSDNLVINTNSAHVALRNVTKIQEFTNSKDSEISKNVKATHLLRLTVTNILNNSSKIDINIKNSPQSWINDISQDTEDNLRTKTNGFKKMIAGLDDAYSKRPLLLDESLSIFITKNTL